MPSAVRLRRPTAADAPAMVAGGNDEIVRWPKGGRNTSAMMKDDAHGRLARPRAAVR
jgi:hypothetical protein